MTSSATRPRLPSLAALIGGQIRYQLQLFLATPGALVIGIGLPVILLVASDTRHGGRAALPVLAGYAVFGLTMTAFNTHGIRLVSSRESGILRRWRACPMPPWCYFVSQIATTSIFATFTGAATFVLGTLFYHTHVSGRGVAIAVAVMLLGALAWSALSTALTGVVPTVETAQPTFILIYFPTLIISGAVGGIGGLPHWLTTLASYLPAEPLTNAVFHALQPGGPPVPPRDIIVMAAWTIGGLLAAVALFRWDPHRPARRRAARPVA